MPDMEMTPIFNKMRDDLNKAVEKLSDAFEEFTEKVQPVIADLARTAWELNKELEANGNVEGSGDGSEGDHDRGIEGSGADTQGERNQDSLWDDLAIQTEGKGSGDNTE